MAVSPTFGVRQEPITVGRLATQVLALLLHLVPVLCRKTVGRAVVQMAAVVVVARMDLVVVAEERAPTGLTRGREPRQEQV